MRVSPLAKDGRKKNNNLITRRKPLLYSSTGRCLIYKICLNIRYSISTQSKGALNATNNRIHRWIDEKCGWRGWLYHVIAFNDGGCEPSKYIVVFFVSHQGSLRLCLCLCLWLHLCCMTVQCVCRRSRC